MIVVQLRLAADRDFALAAARVEAIAPDGTSLLECRVCGHRFAAGAAAGRPPVADRRDERSRQIRVDRDARRHEIVDRELHERTVPGSGARYSEAGTDVYSIVEDEPLTAAVRCARETSSNGPDGSWRVVLTSEMTCDAHVFSVSEEYAAYEGDARVFARTRSFTIPRQGV